MVYDCFIFFNELDLLELRLNELDKVVDKFVLVEADKTFQNQSKPYYFEENKHRFEKFSGKIIHIKLNKYPRFNKLFNPFSPWKLESYQRNAMVEGLKDCKPDDVVLFTDVDEIPSSTVITDFKKNKVNQICGLKMHMFMYFFNNQVTFSEGSKMTVEESKNGLWHCGSIMPYILLKKSPQKYRRAIMRTKRKGEVYKIISNAGWHFTYLGGVEKILEKLEAFSHTEYNNVDFKDKTKIARSLEEGNDLFGRNISYQIIKKESELLPNYLLTNEAQRKFAKHFYSLK
ncbi:hypothetical protein [Mesonia aestuariivivens]|uniref:N-acetylglucosaminyltransferase n=1 Tax=Mesonia aestuariivivens TaxID=2796128 RepID=A0ABS6W0M3_9FLAO|nr:hypothetical protein [Mesonia aestuariivivens]MBW2961386.1 hypothetical protein [Mesonia aestuariivivens]